MADISGSYKKGVKYKKGVLPSRCHHKLTDKVSCDYWDSLPYNMKNLEVTAVVNWQYMNNLISFN